MRVIYNSEILKTPCSSGTNDQLCKMKDFKDMLAKFTINENYTDLCGGTGEWYSPGSVLNGGTKGGAI